MRQPLNAGILYVFSRILTAPTIMYITGTAIAPTGAPGVPIGSYTQNTVSAVLDNTAPFPGVVISGTSELSSIYDVKLTDPVPPNGLVSLVEADPALTPIAQIIPGQRRSRSPQIYLAPTPSGVFDLIAYYDAVAPWLLPYLKDRPVVLTRYPDGIAGKSFFQQDAPDSTPSWVRTERVHSQAADRDIDYFVVDGPEALRYVANLGTIPLHLWSARVTALDRPDWLVLDLDPKGAPFSDVVTVAQTLHGILDDLSLPSYPKTSGASGLHILVPLGARYGHDDVRTFARLLALLAVEARPEISTILRPIKARGGKVYVDFGQNGQGLTVVAPFSVRPLPGAPASCPLEWSEVTARLDPARFTIKTLPARLERTGDPLAPVLKGRIDMAAALARIEGRVGSTRGSRAEGPGAPGRKPGRRRTPRA
jgi:bifunctional non-homologous end joining protein LigD